MYAGLHSEAKSQSEHHGGAGVSREMGTTGRGTSIQEDKDGSPPEEKNVPSRKLV